MVVHPQVAEFRKGLDNGGVRFLDGAGGTLLAEQGYDGVSTDNLLWSATSLHETTGRLAWVGVHGAYLAVEVAGERVVDAITTGSYRTLPYVYERAGYPKDEARLLAREATLASGWAGREAVRLSRAYDVAILGSGGTLEDSYQPWRTPHDSKLLEDEHGVHAQNLKDGGVHAYLVEAVGTAREGLAAVIAARRAGLPPAISLIVGKDGKTLLGGDRLDEFIRDLERYDLLFIAFACMHPDDVDEGLEEVDGATTAAVGVYAQGSEDHTCPNRFEGGAKAYAQKAVVWYQRGARVLGACCGSNPEYIRESKIALNEHLVEQEVALAA